MEIKYHNEHIWFRCRDCEMVMSVHVDLRPLEPGDDICDECAELEAIRQVTFTVVMASFLAVRSNYLKVRR